MTDKTKAWVILISTSFSSIGGVVMAWDGSSLRMLIAGVLLSLGSTITAALTRGVLHQESSIVGQPDANQGVSTSVPAPVPTGPVPGQVRR